jgi:hypothetical protein
MVSILFIGGLVVAIGFWILGDQGGEGNLIVCNLGEKGIYKGKILVFTAKG